MAKTNRTQNVAFRFHPALVILFIAIVLLILAVVALYPAARDYYVAMRENQLLSTEYQALLERNDEIRVQIEEMKTPEGVADKAREELGWVLEGEEAVNITGLGSDEVSTELPPAIEPNSLVVQADWWTQTLDEFFGYAPPGSENKYTDDAIPGL